MVWAIDDHVFEGFERIDLTGSGANSLTLRVSDIYAITEGLNALATDAGIGNAGNTLVVAGTSGVDRVIRPGGCPASPASWRLRSKCSGFSPMGPFATTPSWPGSLTSAERGSRRS